MMKRLLVIITFLFGTISYAQTGLGGMTHIANSAAAGRGVNEGATLCGSRVLTGLTGRNAAAISAALSSSGFLVDSTRFVFGDGAGFAVLCGDLVLPGTWTEKDGRVRLAFSKIFTYSINGRVEVLDGGAAALIFPSEDLLGLCQRVLAIVGRSDTRKFSRSFVAGGEDGFFLSAATPLPRTETPETPSGDGDVTVESDAINEAIARASAAGGDTVRISSGVHYCHSIRLRSDVTLYLEAGAVIKAAPFPGFDAPEPAIDSIYQGFGHIHVHNSLIWGVGLRNVTVCGPGMIDGSSLDSWTEHGRGYANKAIGLRDCRNVTLRGFTVLRGGHFAVHLTAVDSLLIEGLKVDTDRDGIDILCCRDVQVRDCTVNAPQDDAIVLKSPYTMGFFRDVENVRISGCHISGYRCGTMLDGTRRRFSAFEDRYRSGGRIKFGTESSGGYRNVTVRDCTLEYCGGLLLESEDGGVLQDVTVSGIVMRDPLYCPIFIRLGSRMRSPEGTPVGAIRRVSISDVTVTGADSWTSCIISGIPGHRVEDISISGINIAFKGGFSRRDGRVRPPEFERDYPEPWMFGTSPAKGFYIRHATRVRISDAVFTYELPDGRPLYVRQN